MPHSDFAPTSHSLPPRSAPTESFVSQLGIARHACVEQMSAPSPMADHRQSSSITRGTDAVLPPILQRHANAPTQGAVSPSAGTLFRRRRTDQPGLHAQRGFTLIELLFAISIVAILCAVSMPSLSNVLSGGKSRTGSNALITALNLARSTAISRQGDIVMCPSSDADHCDNTIWWQHGWIVFQDLNHNSQRDADEPLLTASQLQTGIAIATSAGREHVTYRGEGTAAGTNLTFTLCDRRGPNYASSVIVSNPGRPRTGPATPAQAAVACAGL